MKMPMAVFRTAARRISIIGGHSYTALSATRCFSSQVGNQTAESSDQVATGYEVVPDRWEYVERILPKPLVPSPPVHASYPTPSGWMPPNPSNSGSYGVRRTRNHMFPVYVEVPTKEKGLKQYTKIKNIEGDIWAFEADLRRFLEDKTSKRIHVQVLEYSLTAIVDGIYHKEVSEFLIKKGF